MTALTMDDHRARLYAMYAAMMAEGNKPTQIVGVLTAYIRRYQVPMAVAHFPDDTVVLVEQGST